MGRKNAPLFFCDVFQEFIFHVWERAQVSLFSREKKMFSLKRQPVISHL